MLALVVALASNTPELLLFGGGPNAVQTPASVEADLGRLSERFRGRSRLLFGTGVASEPVVQAMADLDPVSARLGHLFGWARNLGVRYRPTELTPDAAARPSQVMEAIGALARRSEGGIVIGAGHGRRARVEGGRVVPWSILVWGGELNPTQIAQHLDRVAQGPVSFVLGHCFSGGFSSLVFRGANPEGVPAEPVRCVVAAAPPEREASGCSPDPSALGAAAFLASLAEGLDGAADFDGDRVVRLDEALAYARIHDPTIDEPVRSSEIWLEKRLRSQSTPADIPVGVLLRLADEAERATLAALAPGLGPREITAAVLDGRERLEEIETKLEKAEQAEDAARADAQAHMFDAWPVLANPLHPEARVALAGAAAGVMATWDSAPDIYGRLERAVERARSFRREQHAVQVEMARLRRWSWVADAVWRRVHVEDRDRALLNRMRACESRPLTSLDETNARARRAPLGPSSAPPGAR